MGRKRRIGPYGYHGHFDLGALAHELGRLRRAIAEYRKEISLTNYYKAHYNLGVIYDARRRDREAITEYRAVIRLHPTLAEAHNNLGCVYSRLRRYEDARRAFDRAVRLDRRDPRYSITLGLALVKGGHPREAARHFRRGLRLDPKNVDAMANLGFVLVDDAEAFREGIRVLEAARRLAPSDPEILASLAVGYLKAGQVARANRLARRAKVLAPSRRSVAAQVGRVAPAD